MLVDLGVHHDTRCEKYRKSDTNGKTVGVPISLEYNTPLSQSDSRTRTNCCIYCIYILTSNFRMAEYTKSQKDL